MPINHAVADLTALKAIGASSIRINGYTKFVLSPAAGEPPAEYVYRTSFTAAVLGSIVVAADDNPTNAKWVKTSQLVHYATAAPNAAPPLRGILWVATLSSPSRRVLWMSIGTSATTDWIPFGNQVISSTGAPGFTPDFVGQMYDDRTANATYSAEGVSSSSDWVLRTSA